MGKMKNVCSAAEAVNDAIENVPGAKGLKISGIHLTKLKDGERRIYESFFSIPLSDGDISEEAARSAFGGAVADTVSLIYDHGHTFTDIESMLITDGDINAQKESAFIGAKRIDEHRQFCLQTHLKEQEDGVSAQVE